MWRELLSGSEIRVSTLAVVLVCTTLIYLFIVVFCIVTGHKIPELEFILDNLKGVLGFLTAGVIGNGAISVGKCLVDAKTSNGSESQ